MLQVYSIRDMHFNEYGWGRLTYDTVKKQGVFDFNRNSVNHYYEIPAMIEIYVRRGISHLNEEKTRKFIGGMVQPLE